MRFLKAEKPHLFVQVLFSFRFHGALNFDFQLKDSFDAERQAE